MSSVNKILIFLSIGILNSSLYAVDVSNFDIKGIKLEMSKSEVLKKIPCNNPEILKSYINTINGKKIEDLQIRCNIGLESLRVYLNHNSEVYQIQREIKINEEPSWNKLYNQIIANYGNTKYYYHNKPSKYNHNVFEICYGKCKKDGRYYAIHNDGKTLIIEAAGYLGNGDFEYTRDIKFGLLNDKMLNLNRKWAEKQKKLYKKQQKEKASNIDF